MSAEKARILVADDEAAIADLVVRVMEAEGMPAKAVYGGASALREIESGAYDLAILDVMMPDLDGFEVCRRARAATDMPIVFLTAKDEDVDQIVGLSLGADDYVVKPFMPRELTARIRAVLRRASAEGRARESAVPPADDRQEEIVRCGPLLMNETRFEATADGMPLKLSVKEFRLLLMFASRPGRVFTRGQLLENIWGNSFVDERTVDVHMLRLRKALAGTAAENLIETVRGVGYRCRPLD